MNQLNYIGFNIPSRDSDQKIYFAYNRALEYFRHIIEQNYPGDPEIKSMRDKIARLKQEDPSGMNKQNGIIDYDAFIAKIIEFYRTMVEKTQEYVKYAFAAADLDGSLKLTMKEFLLLFKHVEPAHSNEAALFDLFSHQSDEMEGESEAMSLVKFSELCFARGLFRLETQYSFLGIEKKDEIIFKFDKLIQVWADERNEYLKCIHSTSDIDKDYWREVIKYYYHLT